MLSKSVSKKFETGFRIVNFSVKNIFLVVPRCVCGGGVGRGRGTPTTICPSRQLWRAFRASPTTASGSTRWDFTVWFWGIWDFLRKNNDFNTMRCTLFSTNKCTFATHWCWRQSETRLVKFEQIFKYLVICCRLLIDWKLVKCRFVLELIKL